jgi:prepilin-type N-terminal cleavage/methylation domain-containing protein
MKTTKTRLQQGFTLIELLVVITIIAILAGLAVPAFNGVQEKARMLQGSNNARQIILLLKSYAGDFNGNYPDSDKENPPQSANDAFRQLFVRGLIEDEGIFGCPNSPFTVDKNIGESPDYQEAVGPMENHWCMTKGLTDSASGNAPIVFENPTGEGWPPTWNADVAGTPKEGRAWRGGKILVGKNDGSVNSELLDAGKGDAVSLKTNSSGKDMFTQFSEDGEFLDVAR